MQEVMRTGLARPDEAARIGDEDQEAVYESNWWMPLQWSAEILADSHKRGLVVSQPAYANIIRQLDFYRQGLTDVATYGHIPVPLVYTQVGTRIKIRVGGHRGTGLS